MTPNSPELKPKSRFRAPVIVGIIAGLIGFGYIVTRIFAAGSAQLYLSPASGSYTTGSTVSVQVRVNTTDTVNAVQADFTYPATRLQFQSIDATGSAFDVAASGTGGGGSVSIARGKIGTVTGNVLVATVNFTALTAGSAALAFQGSSAIVRSTDNTNVLGTSTGATYTLSVPSTPAPTPTPTPKTPTPKVPTPTPKPGTATSTPTPAKTTGATAPTPAPTPTPAQAGANPTATPSSTPVVAVAAPSPSPSTNPIASLFAPTKVLGLAAIAVPIVLLIAVGVFIALRRRVSLSNVPVADFPVAPESAPAAPPNPTMPPATYFPGGNDAPTPTPPPAPAATNPEPNNVEPPQPR